MGGVNIKQLDRLKVTLKLSRNPILSPVHSFRNTLDLYNDNQIFGERLKKSGIAKHDTIKKTEDLRIYDLKSQIVISK